VEPVIFGVVGVAGYASSHTYAVEVLEKEGLGKLSAVVVRNPQKHSDIVDSLENRRVTIYNNYEEMLEREAGRIEIISLPTAIHQHKDMTMKALEMGFNVIVEKPPAVRIQDMDEMIEVERRSSGFCAVGFQSQSKNVARALKERICGGELGKIKEVAVQGRWKRLDSYYMRNAWAGRFIYNGQYVLDGTICNPLSHYLMNGLYFAGMEKQQAAKPETVRAELYRGHRIEGEDTSCLEVEVENGARVYFYATLCGPANEKPSHEVKGSKGLARWTVGEEACIQYDDGEVEVLRDDGSDERVEVFRNAARYRRGMDKDLNCSLSLTRSFVLALNGAYESARTIRDIPSQYLAVRREGDSISTTISNIVEIIDEAFGRRRLYSELGVGWAHRTDPFNLRGYRSFNMTL